MFRVSSDLQISLKTGYDRSSLVVQLHGDLETVSCTLCKHTQLFDDHLLELFHEGHGPTCPTCVSVCESI
jgi:NAD-dependent SIR2 family protein deacetylase